MLYITLGDQPSGIYQGQVINVCQYLNRQHNAGIRIVAFISVRDFKSNAQKIKSSFPTAIVLPMAPKLKNWFFNRFTLGLICLFTGERIAICRNVLATKVALSLKSKGLLKKVCFDGRGAMAAEWEEYKVVEEKELVEAIPDLERDAVLQSDFRIAVSTKLVHYWQNRYIYQQEQHVVIPCTLSTNFKTDLPDAATIQKNKLEMGYAPGDIVLIYSGSTAGWQSFTLLHEFLSPLLKSNRNIKVLFLSKEDENNLALKKEFPEQISIKWVNPDEVNRHLVIADYGILLREQSVTNYVASPTKFAEYLIAGLALIISPELGDYTQFVFDHKCGIVVSPQNKVIAFHQTLYEEKVRLNELGKLYFRKDSEFNSKEYERLMNALKI